MSDEKRLHPRRRTLKAGRVVFNRAGSTINCTMRNHSEGGAMLRLVSVVGVPDDLDLKLDGQPMRSGRVVWRRGDELGIEFTSF